MLISKLLNRKGSPQGGPFRFFSVRLWRNRLIGNVGPTARQGVQETKRFRSLYSKLCDLRVEVLDFISAATAERVFLLLFLFLFLFLLLLPLLFLLLIFLLSFLFLLLGLFRLFFQPFGCFCPVRRY